MLFCSQGEKQQPEVNEVIYADVFDTVTSPVTSPVTTQHDSQQTITSPVSTGGGQFDKTADIYSISESQSDSKTRDKERKGIIHMYSYDVADGPTSPTEDSSEQYGRLI